VLSVIVDDARDPVRNLALDEALARAGSATPLLRVWQNAPSVVVGRFQNVGRSVDMAACARDGIPIVRRATGGGAVYIDPGCLIVTLVCSRSGPPPELGEVMATTVEGFGLPAHAVRGETITMAGLRTRHAVLVHGVLRVTTVRSYGPGYLPGDPPRTLVEHGLAKWDREIGLDAVRAAIFEAAADRYGPAVARPPNSAELACRDRLLDSRYQDITWHLSGSARTGVQEVGSIWGDLSHRLAGME